jgi:hypothetical protein
MRFRCLLAAAVLAVSSLAAHADTIDTFSFNSTLSTGTASGLVTFDETTGLFTGGSITALVNGISYLFNQNGFSGPSDTVTGFILSSANGTEFQITIPGTSNIGYTGGQVCSSSNANACPVTGTNGDYYVTGITSGIDDFATSGSLALVSTPEPSSIALLGTGALGMAGLLRKRYMGA